MTPKEKQIAFYTELKDLLKKYKAEICIEDFGRDYLPDEKIVIDFEWDTSLYYENETGIIPQIIIGTSENGL